MYRATNDLFDPPGERFARVLRSRAHRREFDARRRHAPGRLLLTQAEIRCDGDDDNDQADDINDVVHFLSLSSTTVDKKLCVTVDGRRLVPPKTLASYISILHVSRLARHRPMSLSVVGRILQSPFPPRVIVAERTLQLVIAKRRAMPVSGALSGIIVVSACSGCHADPNALSAFRHSGFRNRPLPVSRNMS